MNIQVIIAKIKQYPVAVGAVVLAVVLLAVLYMRSGEIPEMEARQQSLSSEVETYEKNETAAVELDSHLEQLNSLTSKIDNRLMDRSRLTGNVAYFYNFEEEGKLDIESVNQVPLGNMSRAQEREAAKRIYDEIDFTIQVEGTFERLIQFVHDLRMGEKIVRVEDIGISPVSGNQTSPRLRATFSINALGKKSEGSGSSRS